MGSRLVTLLWQVPGSLLCEGQSDRVSGEAEDRQAGRPGQYTPKRSSWARAWRIREAPMRELMEAESEVA